MNGQNDKKLKTSVSLSLFEGADSSPMLFMGDIEKNIPKIAELGYDGVDLFVIDAKSKITKRAVELLSEHGLGVGAVMPAGLCGEGLDFGNVSERIRTEIKDKIKPIIELAAELNGMVSLGLVRGSFKCGDSKDKFLSRFALSIEEILPFSQNHGVDLLLEPINRYEINTINSSLEGLNFINDFQLPIYLMLDTFHMNIEDKSICESFSLCEKFVKHIHFLDSNRLAPSMGHLDMLAILETIRAIDYSGYLCLEALRNPSAQQVAETGMNFFKRAGVK